MTTPGPQEWVQQLDRILREDYFPVLMDEIRSKIGPLVRELLEELRPQILRMVQEEVQFQVNEEVVKKVRILIE